MNFSVCNLATYNGLPTLGTHVRGCVLTLDLRLIPYAKPPWFIHRSSCRYGGRIQIGNQFNLFSQCVPDGKPFVPDAPGTVRIYGGPTTRVAPLPIETTDAETIGLCRGHFTPDHTDQPGRYAAFIGFAVSGVARVEAVAFELAPGGHALGSILSTCTINRPDNTVILAHTESGKITTGRGPYLDEGI